VRTWSLRPTELAGRLSVGTLQAAEDDRAARYLFRQTIDSSSDERGQLGASGSGSPTAASAKARCPSRKAFAFSSPRARLATRRATAYSQLPTRLATERSRLCAPARENVAWKASSGVLLVGQDARQTPHTRGPWRWTQCSEAESSRRQAERLEQIAAGCATQRCGRRGMQAAKPWTNSPERHGSSPDRRLPYHAGGDPGGTVCFPNLKCLIRPRWNTDQTR